LFEIALIPQIIFLAPESTGFGKCAPAFDAARTC
jgi:hypothetical protein